MTQTVYVLGAGFNYSILDPVLSGQAPLARNFFQVLLNSSQRRLLEQSRELLGEIERYWKLDLDTLSSAPFDIEECLTFFESQFLDKPEEERITTPEWRCAIALRNLLLSYLGDLNLKSAGNFTPASTQFGRDVITTRADILTFNYDTSAEAAVESASGIFIPPRILPTPLRPPEPVSEVPSDYLDASYFRWNRNLAYGIQFDEVAIPMPGIPRYVNKIRYYGHPSNNLYTNTRVLKLHGSIDWLKYTQRSAWPRGIGADPGGNPPSGTILAKYNNYWRLNPPEHKGWLMDPVIIPPQLYKKYDTEPYLNIWPLALSSLT
jgi:hypothetical protein